MTLCFGAIIWFTSTTVVTVDELASAVCAVLPIERSQFKVFWEESWWFFVKGWHAAEFGLLYWLLNWTLSRFSANKWWAVSIAIACAFIDEIHQTSVAARGGRLSDVAIDCVGIGVTALLLARDRENRRFSLPVVGLGLLFAVGLIWALALHPFGTTPKL